MIGCGGAVSVTLIFFGALLLLESLGVSDGIVGRYWPLILIILGVMSIINMVRFRVRFRQYRERFGRQWPPDIDQQQIRSVVG